MIDRTDISFSGIYSAVSCEITQLSSICQFFVNKVPQKKKKKKKMPMVKVFLLSHFTFQEVLDYVQRHPASEEKVQDEFSLCKEMVTLLPHKLARIANSTGPL